MVVSQLLDTANWPTALIAGLAAAISSAVTVLLSYARFRRSDRLSDNTDAVLRGMFQRGYRTRKFEILRHFIPLEDSKLGGHCSVPALFGSVRLRPREVEQCGT
ncbi:hypothetical protein ACN2C8_13875 [Caulobacter sp. ErkDOM-C]|uniref:hypothetical protein n=1 Tax=Caulobacter sp. ErkDOM-C TaxID=3402777 RepID=UPI003AF828E9